MLIAPIANANTLTSSEFTTADNNNIFKADAPEDYRDVNKRNYGSIWPNKKEFFNNLSSDAKNSKQNTEKKAFKVEDPKQAESTKKDKAWKAALKTLESFTLSYANEEPGVIKTNDAYVSEFDSTNSCKYKIIVNISDSGDVTVCVKSAEDSPTRIKKHEELMKTKIISAINNNA